jgi:hypothetical protein
MLVAGVVSLPLSSYAQAPAGPAAPPASAQAKAEGPKADAGMPQDHLQQADTAVKSISSGAVSSKAAARIAELKQHLSALQTMAATPAGPAAAASTNAHAGHGGQPPQSAQAGQTAPQWATHTAAADKIIGELLADTSPGATAPARGTEPAAAGAPAASATPPLDAETKAKLSTARASLTAFAASMTGAAAPQAAAAPAASNPATTSTSASPATTASAASPAAQSQSSAAPAQPAPSASATEQTAQAEAPQGAPAAQPPSAAAPAAPATASASHEAAKQALTAARDSLSQLTKLPAAQQLTGEARTQISQLIADFNALITTTTDWKSAYAKVDADVTAMLGAPTADQPAPAAPSATPGAVGTSGTETGGLDPVLRSKLGEFRAHLKAFEKAAAAEK